jgi:uncharacterized membrane-anchored protein
VKRISPLWFLRQLRESDVQGHASSSTVMRTRKVTLPAMRTPLRFEKRIF